METQERILQKAHELFMLYGVRSVSMDEIAAHLGISKKTIYQFYTDKDSLVEGVIGIEINNNEQECIAYRNKCENAVHEIFLAIDMMQEVMKSMHPSILFELEKYHPKAHKKLNEHKHQFILEMIKDNLERGKQEGVYREELNIPIIAHLRLGSIFLTFNPEAFPMTKNNIIQVLQEITDHFLFGIVSAKGAKLIQKYKQQRQKE